MALLHPFHDDWESVNYPRVFIIFKGGIPTHPQMLVKKSWVKPQSQWPSPIIPDWAKFYWVYTIYIHYIIYTLPQKRDGLNMFEMTPNWLINGMFFFWFITLPSGMDATIPWIKIPQIPWIPFKITSQSVDDISH